ncbi:hypothetical protein, partial [Escherichia coli]|uniref:hypothetical protein n=1 Tax=Escherichia coli TaxID=562 RepID=UPI003EE0AF06
ALTFQNHTNRPLTDFGGKMSIFSHPVYLFLREFSLQDSRGGSTQLTPGNKNISLIRNPDIPQSVTPGIAIINLITTIFCRNVFKVAKGR